MTHPGVTEETYYRLTRICDRVLQHPDATLEWVAIPWLHIINEVPFVLSGYADVIDALETESDDTHRSDTTSEVLRRCHKTAYRFAFLMRNLIRSIAHPHAQNLDTTLPALKNGRVDVLIVSWLINIDHLAGSEDFYFGNLQAMLAAQGFSSLLVLRNQSGNATNGLLKKAVRTRPFQRLMLPDHTTVSKEFDFLRRCFRTRQKMQKAGIDVSDPSERRLFRRAGERVLSNEVVQNLRLHAQIQTLCRRTRPSIVMTLYEGHAWERCVYHAARRASPPGLCVGYQHTVLRKRSHALKRSLSPHHGFDPDIVLTVGEVTQWILEKSNALNGVKSIVFGTHRRTGDDGALCVPRSESTVLVLPEGDGFECIYLFEFAIKCAERLPTVRFIFRTHPYFPIKRLVATEKWQIPKNGNIEISRRKKIEDDFSRTGYLLYRGSSTVIYAILSGLKPFYFARPNELNFDPIFELSTWRQDVYSVDDFIDKYQKDRNTETDTRIQQWEKARGYCDKYVQHIRKDTINKMIEIAGATCNNQYPS